MSQFAALGTRAYRHYWLGSVVSVGGLQLQTIGQGWLVFELTHKPVTLGLLGAAASIPSILVSLFGGAVADRLDKRVVLRTTALVNVVLILLLAWLDFSGQVQVWHVLTIAGVQSLVTGLDWPTRSALYPMLIDREHMMSAVALNSIVWQGTRMVMPAIGGALLAYSDTWVLFLLAAIGMLCMAIVVHRLDVHAPGVCTGTALGQTLEGMRFILNNRLFLMLMLLAYFTMFFGSSYVQLMPAFAKLLNVGSSGFGVLLSAAGLGSILGTFAAGYVQRNHRSGRMMLLCAGVFAPCLMLFALVTQFAAHTAYGYGLALACVLAAGVASSTYNIVSMTLMQMRVPDALRGRVMGIHGISFSFMSLGALFTGAIAAQIGTPMATLVSAAIVLTVVLWMASTQSVVRDQGAIGNP